MNVLSKLSNLISPSGKELKSSQPKIRAFVLPSGFSGCAWWRLRVPLAKLKEVRSDRLDFYVEETGRKALPTQEVIAQSMNTNVIVLQAPGSWEGAQLLYFHQKEGKKAVIDYDDFSFDLDPGNPRYNALGTKEIEIKGDDGKVIHRWKDMENEFDLKSNISRYEAFIHTCYNSDLITTTTEYLANKFRKFNPNVKILPNSIDFDLFRPLRKPEKFKDKIRVGWFGGDSHFVDLKGMKNVFKTIVQKYPNTVLTFLCPEVDLWRGLFEGIDPSRIDWHSWSEIDIYPFFLANRSFDIGLAPLADNEFNKCKSNIKFLEFSSLKVPVVAQDMIPYSNTIIEGETGLLAKTEEDWVNKVSTLIENEELRKKLSTNAYNFVKEKYDLANNCKIWEQTYIDVYEKPSLPKFICKCIKCKGGKEWRF